MQREIVASAPQALQVLASCLNHKGEQQSYLHTLTSSSSAYTGSYAEASCTWHKLVVRPKQQPHAYYCHVVPLGVLSQHQLVPQI